MAFFFPQRALIYAFLLFLLVVVGTCSPLETESVHLPHQLRALNKPLIQKRQNVSTYDVTQAQKIVAEAVAQQSIYNTHRFDHPKRNTYLSRNSNEAKAAKQKRDVAPIAPTLNATIVAAASLIAEVHAAAQQANGTLHRTYSQPQYVGKFNDATGNTKRATGGDYWVSKITHTGHAHIGSDNSYLVYRDVTNTMFAGGAKGDGLTDDTAAINAAIAYGNNCGQGCLSSSIKGTLIYFPPGTYLISSPINAYYYSQLVGDKNDLPIIKTSQQFIGLGAIQSDVYIPNQNGDEWYIEQSNFYRQVRNFIIDMAATTTDKAAGLHWQIAQATSLTNVYIYASTAAGNTQMGIFTENGSGGFMSDCFLSGGKYGIYGGNQQYTVRKFEFSSQTTAGVCLLWYWGWTWSGITFTGSPVGFLLIPPPEENSNSTPGSIYVMDTLFDGVATAIEARSMHASILDTSIITLDNIGVLNVNTMVAFSDGYHVSIPAVDTEFVIIGNVGLAGATGIYSADVAVPAPSLLDPTAPAWWRDSYFAKGRPQYEDLGIGSIISVKDHGAVGDGVHDDTAAIVATLALATTSNLIYFPAGSYIVTSTITIPPHVRMTGEVWSQIVASGPFFANIAAPKPMIQVGSPGDVGTVEISDMLFTSIGALPGLIMMEWNVAAATPGSVGIWDAHFRVGGAYGTKLQVAQCPPSPTIPIGCIAATMMLHITPSSNGYFENVWAWVADHDIDDPTNKMVTVAAARGILVESGAGPTWFYGTASEHAILYQYNFFNTTDTFAGMIQTESPYYQYAVATESPGPLNASIGLFSNDPIFPDDTGTCIGTDSMCNFAWAVILSEVTNLTIAGAGLYSWFDAYDQSVCVDAQNCQQRLVNDQGYNGGLYVWNLVTIGAVEMISDTFNDDSILAANNTQLDSHPFWSALGAYAEDVDSDNVNCPDDSTDPACMVNTYCDYTREFKTLDELQAASGTFLDICTSYYALGVLNYMLTAEVANYTTVNKGYDGVFDDYVDYVKEMVPDALGSFMATSTATSPAGGAGQQFFDCKFTSAHPVKSVAHACPIDWREMLGTNTYTMAYTLRDSDGFYKALASNYGINSTWVVFGNSEVVTRCGRGSGPCLQTDATYQGIPQAAKGFTVSNPKDIITNALPKVGALQDSILARKMDLASNTWYGPTDNVLQVLSMPVFMISQSLDAMAQVKAVGEKEKKDKKLALIIEILGIVFAFIPFLEEIGPSLGVADGIFEIASAAGNVALAIQGIIAHPDSAPMELLGLITAGGSRVEKDFADMAAARRAISDDDLTSIGTVFKAANDKLQNALKHNCLFG